MRFPMLLAVMATIAAGAVACSGGGSDAPSCSSYQAEDSVTMADFSYTPACISAPGGATLTLDNQGDAPHTFTVEGTPVSVEVQAGDHATADLGGVGPGTYTVMCTYHPQMKATIQVG